MNLTWDLETLYPCFESEKFKGDQELLRQYITELNDWADVNLHDHEHAAAKMEDFLRRYNAFRSVYTCLYSYADLILNADSSTEAMSVLDDIVDTSSAATDAFVKFNKWLKGLDRLDTIIDTSPYLSEHRFYLSELLDQSKFLLSEEIESVIAKMQNTGSKAWQRFYMQCASNVLTNLDVEGESRSVSLSELRNMAYDRNPSLRKAAYNAEAEACKSIAEQSAACINGISGEAITVYGMRGYQSPLEKVLAASRMDAQTLQAMQSAIQENLPIFHKYYEKKAMLLGHTTTSLPFYDIFAPIGEGNVTVSYSEARDCIVSSFRTFSDDLADFAQKVFDNRWVDAEPRAGKGNYGMCIDIFPIQESRILTNFTGSYIDISVLAHEIGHAYHSSCLVNETMVNTDYPTPIAETASIFCESIVNNELLRIAPTGEAVSILERGISDAGYYIVDFYGRYLFENKMYERRQSGALSVEELNELMLACMTEVYGEGIDPATIHPYMWLNKMGYFLAGNEYLNFPYSFGLLFSKGLYAQYKKRGQAFVAQYHAFLSATSKNNIVDAAKIMGIDVHSSQFWKDALQLIEEEIEEFISRV